MARSGDCNYKLNLVFKILPAYVLLVGTYALWSWVIGEMLYNSGWNITFFAVSVSFVKGLLSLMTVAISTLFVGGFYPFGQDKFHWLHIFRIIGAILALCGACVLAGVSGIYVQNRSVSNLDIGTKQFYIGIAATFLRASFVPVMFLMIFIIGKLRNIPRGYVEQPEEDV